MGAARRQVGEGGAGAGESVVEVQARYNCFCPRVQALPSARMFGREQCGSVLRRAMNVRGAVSQCRLLAAVRPPPAGGGQNPRNATWSLSGNFVRMIFPPLIIPILRPVGIPVLPFHRSALKLFEGKLQNVQVEYSVKKSALCPL